MENPIKMDDLGVPLIVGNTHIHKTYKKHVKALAWRPHKLNISIDQNFAEKVKKGGWFSPEVLGKNGFSPRFYGL